jgi:N-acetylmuramoyl-L-alanine amidase
LSAGTVNTANIKVIGEDNKYIDISVSLENGNKSVVVQSVKNYESNKTYTLIVTEKVKSVDGQPLPKEVRMNFVTINEPTKEPIKVPTKPSELTVCIDPAQYFRELSSINGDKAKDINLSIALKLGNMLKTKGFNVVYTRDSDSVSWNAASEDDAKATIAKNAKADVYLSINANTYLSSSVKGIETYYLPNVSNNKILAGLVQSELIKATEATNRGIKEAGTGVTFDILRKSSCPSIVLELGFLSNPEEATLLSSEAYQNNAAKAIASGLMNYGGFENTDDEYDSIFDISSVEDVTVELEEGSTYVFPKTMQATMSNNSKKYVGVQWPDASVDLSYTGTYIYEGIIKGYDTKVKVIINVVEATIKNYKVVLDAGHGGHDSGAIGPKGIQEKTIALAISLKVGNILTKNGVETVYTRESDVISWSTNETKNLQQRCDISTAAKPDYFISIHVNSAEISSASGIETYYKSLDAEGQKLAKAVQVELIKETGAKDRGIKTAGFYVLKYTNVTSILVETAFISNPEEEQLLTTQEYQNKLAKAISTGILKSLGITNIVD